MRDKQTPRRQKYTSEELQQLIALLDAVPPGGIEDSEPIEVLLQDAATALLCTRTTDTKWKNQLSIIARLLHDAQVTAPLVAYDDRCPHELKLRMLELHGLSLVALPLVDPQIKIAKTKPGRPSYADDPRFDHFIHSLMLGWEQGTGRRALSKGPFSRFALTAYHFLEPTKENRDWDKTLQRTLRRIRATLADSEDQLEQDDLDLTPLSDQECRQLLVPIIPQD